MSSGDLVADGCKAEISWKLALFQWLSSSPECKTRVDISLEGNWYGSWAGTAGNSLQYILVSFQPPLLLKSTWIFNYLSDPLFILLAQKHRIKPTPCFPSNSLTVFCCNYCTIILFCVLILFHSQFISELGFLSFDLLIYSLTLWSLSAFCLGHYWELLKWGKECRAGPSYYTLRISKIRH